MVWSSPNSAGYEHAGHRPELHKGTPRMEQERRRVEPRPNERAARRAALGAPNPSKARPSAPRDRGRRAPRPTTPAAKDHAHACARSKREETKPPYRPKTTLGNGRRVGDPISACQCRRWPNPCKGWPSATASGGFGLDKGSPIGISRCPRDRRAGVRLQSTRRRQPPTAASNAKKRAALLTKKPPYEPGHDGPLPAW